MEELDGSLHSQHAQIDELLESVVAAGLAGRWAEYRLCFGALHEGVLQHMTFEEEAVFPVLETRGVPGVSELLRQHVDLRQRLEVLAVASAERDPGGCLAELGRLAEALRAHHAAEMALDPQYAVRRTPRLRLDEPATVDLRGLPPPEPIMRIFEALERSRGRPLRAILPHEPVPLYGLLRERGFAWSGAQRPDGAYELLIETA